MNSYWEKRAEQSVKRYEAAVNRSIPEAIKAFEAAKRDIQQAVYSFWGRYAKNNQISLEQAKKELSRKELAEFRGNLKEYEQLAKNSIGTFNLEVENISTKIRLTRLDALLMQIDARLQQLYIKQKEIVTQTVEQVTVEEYYRSQYDISVSTGRLFAFCELPDSFIEQVLSAPVEGVDISTRLWRQDIDSCFFVRQTLNRMFIEGRPPQDFAEELAKKIGAVQIDKDGRATGSGKKYEAYRLLYNEASYASNQARLKGYRDTGVPFYEITATLDQKTSPVCQSLDGCIFSVEKGGEVPEKYKKTDSEYRQAAYSAKSVRVGVNYPPFHVNCRTVATAYYETTDTASMTRAARDAEGNPITVPADMKYEEYQNRYLKETLPKVKKAGDTTLQNTLASPRMVGIVPKESKIEKVVVIAGRGSRNILRDTPRLVAQHGGEEWKWEKKSGIIKSKTRSYESHWYEYEGKQYENKLKER